jgi:hypothetical protein
MAERTSEERVLMAATSASTAPDDSVLSFINGATATNVAELIGAARRRSDKFRDRDSVPCQRSLDAAIPPPEGAHCSIVLVQWYNRGEGCQVPDANSGASDRPGTVREGLVIAPEGDRW